MPGLPYSTKIRERALAELENTQNAKEAGEKLAIPSWTILRWARERNVEYARSLSQRRKQNAEIVAEVQACGNISQVARHHNKSRRSVILALRKAGIEAANPQWAAQNRERMRQRIADPEMRLRVNTGRLVSSLLHAYENDDPDRIKELLQKADHDVKVAALKQLREDHRALRETTAPAPRREINARPTL